MGKKDNELVSIVIPTYNSSDYLVETINSCIEQTYKNIEIIICDDGSTDKTVSIAKAFTRKYPNKISYFKLKHTGSPAIPRNAGMKAAKGKYIAFLDSDDIMKKNKLAKQVNLMKTLKDVDFICTNASIIDQNSKDKNISYFSNLEEGFLSLKKLLESNNIIQSTVLMKKSALLKVGYYLENETEYHEDYEYWLRAMSLNSKIYYSRKNLTYYRINTAGISRRMSAFQGITKNIKTLEIVCKNINLNNDIKKMFKNQIKKNKRIVLIEKLKKYKKTYFFIKNILFQIFYPLIYLFKWLRFNIILKHKRNVKLHLGCGEKYIDGYINIDYPPKYSTIQLKYRRVDFYSDITKLKLKNNTVDEIRLHHVFEHFTYPETLSLLIKWNKALKKNGKLIIETPDVKTCFEEVLSQEDFKKQAQILRHIFGSHEASWAIHKDGWYKEKYKFILPKLGFTIIKITLTKYKSTRNIVVCAIKKNSLSDKEFQFQLKKILNLYLIDESETKLFNKWISCIKLK